jgi:polyferredoxin
MENGGLLILGLIQLSTAITMFLSVNQTHIFGIVTLPRNFSIYRYMLTALWMSVSIVYFAGAFSPVFTKGASLLAVINVLLEIIGYWMSNLPRRFQIQATIVMVTLGIWSGSSLL